MKQKRIFLILAFAFFFCNDASADFYFQQDVRTTQKGGEEGLSQWAGQDFRRKIYVLGQVFVIQIEEDGRLKKEYGFDFGKNLYYEAAPADKYYKLFDLKVLAEAFQKIALQSRGFRKGRRGIADDLSKGLVDGQIDYPGRIRQAFFAKKQFDGRPARLYKLRVGPGTDFLNFFGWYRKADIWAATDLPGFSEYEAVRAHLAKKAVFYKIKNNKISDLVITLSVLKGVPLDIDSVAKRRFERSTSEEASREITALISTSPIKAEQILYFKERPRFSWNTVFSEGTEFGPEVSVASNEKFDVRQSMPWLIIPACFFVFAYLWFFGGYREMDEFSLTRLVILRITILLSILFGLEVVRYLSETPYLISPLFEIALASGFGVAWIVWEACVHQKNTEKLMRNAHLRFCPHCHARCETFYIACPKCNRSFMPDLTQGPPQR